ncbi:hypothetical protein HanRHA438_Chr06g0254161 [Helianthus annuus]|nr:hypothetical protein HanRHA438_Chr06g0254161 [Helianthus annuus]
MKSSSESTSTKASKITVKYRSIVLIIAVTVFDTAILEEPDNRYLTAIDCLDVACHATHLYVSCAMSPLLSTWQYMWRATCAIVHDI